MKFADLIEGTRFTDLQYHTVPREFGLEKSDDDLTCTVRTHLASGEEYYDWSGGLALQWSSDEWCVLVNPQINTHNASTVLYYDSQAPLGQEVKLYCIVVRDRVKIYYQCTYIVLLYSSAG